MKRLINNVFRCMLWSALCVAGARAAPANEPGPAERMKHVEAARDVLIVEGHYYRYGPPPGAEVVTRLVGRLKSGDADPALLFCVGMAVTEKWTAEPLDARALFKRAADAGHLPSRAAYATGLVTGQGGPADPRAGLALLRETADLGDALADYNLGRAHYAGVAGAVKQDSEAAEKAFSRAVEHGMTRGLNGIARVVGQRGDFPAALAAATRAAEAGDSEMMAFLVRWFDDDPRVKDPVKALYWMRRGAMLGYPNFMVAYARALDDGRDGPADPALMSSLLVRAAEQGNLEAAALVEVGRVTNWYGVPRDAKIGLANLRLLAEAKNQTAQYWFGRILYERAPATDQEARSAAREWIVQAAVAGHKEAINWFKAHK